MTGLLRIGSRDLFALVWEVGSPCAVDLDSLDLLTQDDRVAVRRLHDWAGGHCCELN